MWFRSQWHTRRAKDLESLPFWIIWMVASFERLPTFSLNELKQKNPMQVYLKIGIYTALLILFHGQLAFFFWSVLSLLITEFNMNFWRILFRRNRTKFYFAFRIWPTLDSDYTLLMRNTLPIHWIKSRCDILPYEAEKSFLGSLLAFCWQYC